VSLPSVSRLARILALGVDGVVALAFPSRCVVCQTDIERPLAGSLCGSCRNSLSAIVPPYCPRCGLPYPSGVAPGVCGPCRRPGRGFRLARSAGRYEGVLKEGLVLLKFGGRHRLAGLLGRLAYERCFVNGGLEVPHVVIPVPLSRRRERKRGYNQAALLGRAVASAAGVDMRRGLLVKVRECPPQMELSAARRRLNVLGAFRANLPPSLRGKHLLLVDDIMTTGATVEACSRALLRAGAGSVDVLTVSRVGL
jgi:ComF family protein